MKKVDVGKEVLVLHRKYIVNGEKPRMSFSTTGTRSLHHDEVYPFREAFRNAPRIGRAYDNRKKDDELVAVPRGLLLYLVDEARYGLYVHDLWLRGELDKLDQERGTDD